MRYSGPEFLALRNETAAATLRRRSAALVRLAEAVASGEPETLTREQLARIRFLLPARHRHVMVRYGLSLEDAELLTREDLMTLPGVGAVIAGRIKVAARRR